MTIRLLAGDCRDVLPTLPADSVHCVVTSPPYYGLREMSRARITDDAPLFTQFPVADPEETRMADLFAPLAAD